MTLSIWGIGLIILGVFILNLASYLIGYYREYIPVYRSPKVFLLIMIPIIIYGEIILWQIVIAEYNNTIQIVWPDQTSILFVIIVIFLFVAFIVSIRLFGKQWLLRHKYRKFTQWGPYITLGSLNLNALHISWQNHKPNQKNTVCIQNNHNNLHPNTNSHIVQGTKIWANKNYHVWSIISEEPLFFENFRYVIDGNTRWAQIHSFNPNKNHFKCIILSDLHAGGDPIGKIFEILNRRIEKVDFILFLGDLISDGQDISHWRTFFAQANEILPKIPIIYLPGNHDGYASRRVRLWQSLLRQPLIDASDGSYFSFTYGNVHFILLDNYNSKTEFIGFSNKQIQWLTHDLQSAQMNQGIKYIFICLHNPIYSTSIDGCEPILDQILHPLILQYDKIKCVFSGHCHFYQRFTENFTEKKTENTKTRDVTYIITSWGGNLPWNLTHRFAFGPYRWTSTGHHSIPEFIPRKGFHQYLQNNVFIKKNHRNSKIVRNFIEVSKIDNSVEISAFDENEELIDHLEFPDNDFI